MNQENMLSANGLTMNDQKKLKAAGMAAFKTLFQGY